MTLLAVGDLIEFRSAARGGVWKRGTVEAVLRSRQPKRLDVRIRVGENIYVVRPARDCRLVVEEGEREGEVDRGAEGQEAG